jgi:hypothetical protein
MASSALGMASLQIGTLKVASLALAADVVEYRQLTSFVACIAWWWNK